MRDVSFQELVFAQCSEHVPFFDTGSNFLENVETLRFCRDQPHRVQLRDESHEVAFRGVRRRRGEEVGLAEESIVPRQDLFENEKMVASAVGA